MCVVGMPDKGEPFVQEIACESHGMVSGKLTRQQEEINMSDDSMSIEVHGRIAKSFSKESIEAAE